MLYMARPDIEPHQGSTIPKYGFVSRQRVEEALKVWWGLLYLKGMTSPFSQIWIPPPHLHKGPVEILLSVRDLPSLNKCISPNTYNNYSIQSSGNLYCTLRLNHFTYMCLPNEIRFWCHDCYYVIYLSAAC